MFFFYRITHKHSFLGPIREIGPIIFLQHNHEKWFSTNFHVYTHNIILIDNIIMKKIKHFKWHSVINENNYFVKNFAYTLRIMHVKTLYKNVIKSNLIFTNIFFKYLKINSAHIFFSILSNFHRKQEISFGNIILQNDYSASILFHNLYKISKFIP